MAKKIVKEIKSQTLTLMVAALGFVAALVWKDAITAWLKPLYADAAGAAGLTWAAIIVTAVTVVVTIVLTQLLGEKE
ncbi:hypothetical protein D6774_01915 [Candidatus Woesearchaeota archaeon]|nr:MAG: hypothetical protein D6774_01915 [Candidatus Woesearchaeota archaeon]